MGVGAGEGVGVGVGVRMCGCIDALREGAGYTHCFAKLSRHHLFVFRATVCVQSCCTCCSVLQSGLVFVVKLDAGCYMVCAG